MNKLLSSISLLFQLFITFSVLFVIYLIYALLDMVEIDIITGLGFLVFQPLLGIVLISVTILICLIIGLPVRVISKVRKRWLSFPLIPLIGVAVGFILFFLSFNEHFTQSREIVLDAEMVQKKVPNMALTATGWFLIAFCLLHFYPMALLKLIKSKRNKVYD